MTQGWQSFTTGEVLTSTAMNQVAASTVNVFASASARDAAIPGSDLAEGLICYLLDDNSIYTYSGSGWVINGTGTITGITTSNGLAGSGTSGSVALTLDTDAKGDLLVGTGADTSTKLSVGTNTHVLTADSSTASGLVWSAPTTGDITGVTTSNGIAGGGTSGSVAITLDTDAKGDLLVGTGADTSTKLGVGSNNQLLQADSSTASGLVWATVSSGGISQIATASMSNVSNVTIDSIPDTFQYLHCEYSFTVPTSALDSGVYIKYRTGGSDHSGDYTYVLLKNSGGTASTAANAGSFGIEIVGLAKASTKVVGQFQIYSYANSSGSTIPLTVSSSGFQLAAAQSNYNTTGRSEGACAISGLTLQPHTATTLATDSTAHFTVYGVS